METKTCKYCKSEIDKKAKICPNCRKKQKGGILGKVLIAIIILAIIGVALSGGGDDKSASTEAQKTESVKKDSGEKAVKEEETEAKKEYEKYDVQELIDDVQSNALKAQKKYKDQLVSVTGYLSNIDSDGAYIDINAGEDDYAFVNIQCYLNSDEQTDVVMDLSIGDKIVVKGTCTDVGEVMGYSIQVDSIKKKK